MSERLLQSDLLNTHYAQRTLCTPARTPLFLVMEFYYLVLLLLRGNRERIQRFLHLFQTGSFYDQLGLHGAKLRGFTSAKVHTLTHIDIYLHRIHSMHRIYYIYVLQLL